MDGSPTAPRRRSGAPAAPPPAAASAPEPAPASAPEPAAAIAGEAERATSFLQRAPLRRRLRFLRRRRELALRDLGGLVFESHRQGGENADVLAEKLGALSTLEREREQLERALDERQELALLREPGITVCGACAALHGSEDNYCPHCGAAVGRTKSA